MFEELSPEWIAMRQAAVEMYNLLDVPKTQSAEWNKKLGIAMAALKTAINNIEGVIP